MTTDPHGQPYNLGFNRARRAERDLSELLGLAKGLLADGVVTPSETGLLRDWVQGHPDAVEQWPVNQIAARLERIFADGQVSTEEQADLSELLRELVGGGTGIIGGADAATDLPLDAPPPDLRWTGCLFVFTGKFAFGTRSDCQRHTETKGGSCQKDVTRDTTYLVIGTFGSRDWVHTSFGRKIEKAVSYRDSGAPLAIVAEDHWAAALDD